MKKYLFVINFLIIILALFSIIFQTHNAFAVDVPDNLLQTYGNSDDAYAYCMNNICAPINSRAVSCTSGACQYDKSGRTWDQVNNENEYNQCVQDCATKTTAKTSVATTTNSAPLTWTPNVGIGRFVQGVAVPITGNNLLGTYIDIWYKFLVGLAGLLATVMIIMGGITWLTSGGSSATIGDAKKTISSALIGLTLALLSYALLQIINPNLTTISPISLGEIKFDDNYIMTNVGVGNPANGNGAASCTGNTTIVGGYNLKGYAEEGCAHINAVNNNFQKMASANIADAGSLQKFIDQQGMSASPITGQMIWDAAGGDKNLAYIMTATMIQEDHLLTDPNGQIAIQNNNPGDIKYAGQSDATAGTVVDGSNGTEHWARYNSVQAGVQAVANLMRNRKE